MKIYGNLYAFNQLLFVIIMHKLRERVHLCITKSNVDLNKEWNARRKKNNSIDNAISSPNVNVFRLILFSTLAHRLSIWRGDYLIVCWHADKKSTLENRNNCLFRMEFCRIAFSVLSLLFSQCTFILIWMECICMKGETEGVEVERAAFTFITILILKLHQCEWVEKLFA